MADAITSKLAKLLHKRVSRDEDDEGEAVDQATDAGGRHGHPRRTFTEAPVRVSDAIRSYLVKNNILSAAEAQPGSNDISPALRELLNKPHAVVPAELTDRSHPLPEYFISSSHNTYLMAHQLYGKSSAAAYETALSTGSRCVEIDAWDNEDNMEEPKVTHGYTLVSHISFRAVCETIRDVVDLEATHHPSPQGYRAAPIIISLENHCGPQGQLRLVQIMEEVLGDKLLSKPVIEKGHAEQAGTGDHVTLDQLGSKVVLIVEFHFPNEPNSETSESSSDEEEDRSARKSYNEKKKNQKAASTVIIPELAALGVYAQSVKPRDNSWYDQVTGLKDGPHHHLINVSESGLASHMPTASNQISQHNAHHLMRVYPKGTRISSKNLKPVPFWAVGAQICAMNWQTFGAAMQIKGALFSNTDGYVLKPACLRPGAPEPTGQKRMRRLKVLVAGATDIPIPADLAEKADDMKPYVTCTLIHPADIEGNPPKRKTSPYKQHKHLKMLHKDEENPPVTDPLWDETLEWEFDDGDAAKELVFLRVLIKSDISLAANPVFAVAAIRLSYLMPGWSFVRMLDLKGHETSCSLLLKTELEDM